MRIVDARGMGRYRMRFVRRPVVERVRDGVVRVLIDRGTHWEFPSEEWQTIEAVSNFTPHWVCLWEWKR